MEAIEQNNSTTIEMSPEKSQSEAHITAKRRSSNFSLLRLFRIRKSDPNPKLNEETMEPSAKYGSLKRFLNKRESSKEIQNEDRRRSSLLGTFIVPWISRRSSQINLSSKTTVDVESVNEQSEIHEVMTTHSDIQEGEKLEEVVFYNSPSVTEVTKSEPVENDVAVAVAVVTME